MITTAQLYTVLAADAPLVAAVSTRVYPSHFKGDLVVPYIIWDRVASTPFTTHNEPAGNQFDLFQFAVFAKTFEEAENIALLLVSALDNVLIAANDIAALQTRNSTYDAVAELYRSNVDFLV